MFEKKYTIPAVFIIVAILSGCFSPWEPNEATISLNLGNNNGRAAVSDAILNSLDYTVVLTGATGTKTLSHKGTGIITATVTPGNWEIKLEAWFDDVLFAAGSDRANIKAGQRNAVTIKMNIEVTLISNRIELERIGTDSTTLAGKYLLIADIDLSGSPWTPIGASANPFTGTFDGNGHIISGLTIDSTSDKYPGFIGYIDTGTVKNLGLVNVYIYNTDSNNGNGAGGIGYNKDGTIQNCYVTGSITGYSYVGGISGYNNGGTIENCYTTADITVTTGNAGGITGNNWGTIKNCYATGSITNGTGAGGGLAGYNTGGNTISNSVALNSAITGNGTSGRIANFGTNPTGTFINNYARADMTTSGFTPPAPSAGDENTQYGAEVSTSSPNGGYNSQSFWQNTMGWDFANVWKMGTVNGQTLPVLR